MFCPKCRYEYVEGVTECPDCQVELVQELPKEEPKYSFVEMVTIMIPQDMSELLIAKSILEDAEIRHFAKNEHIQNLFGVGQLGSGFNQITGPIELQVPKEDAETALALLAEVTEGEIEIEVEDFEEGKIEE